MKKYISVIISLTMILSCFVLSYAEDPEANAIATEAINAIGLLKAMDIIDISAEDTELNVTRQEFVKNLYMLIVNIGYDMEKTTESVYSDVRDEEYIPYINAMTRLGIVNGFADGTFAPENKITVFEGLTLILRALGYDAEAEAGGGYPYGYAAAAKKAGITGSVEAGSGALLTMGSMAILFKNALKTDIYERKITSDTESYTYQKTNKTLLDLYNIGYVQGIVEGIDATRLYGESSVPPWHVYIGGSYYDVGETDPENLLGLNVEMYYKTETDTILYISEKPNVNKIIEIAIEDITEIKGNNIVIEKGGREYKYPYNPSAFIIYNMAATRNSLSMVLLKDEENNILSGKITLINNDSVSGYDVVKILAGKNIVAKSIDIINSEVEDYNSGKRIKLDTDAEEPFVEIFDAEGKEMEFSDIKSMSVITFYETMPDASQKMIRAYASENKINGSVETISEDKFMELTIGGVSYNVAKACEKYFADIDSGKSYVFYLSADGFIVGYDNSGNIGSWGMIINANKVLKGIEYEAYIRMMDQRGISATYELADNVKLDGVIYKEKTVQIMDYLTESSKADYGAEYDGIYTQLILYKTDSEGKINYIDTVLNAKDRQATVDDLINENTLYIKRGVESEAFNITGASTFEGGVVLPGTVPLFVRPSNTSEIADIINPDNYYMASRSSRIVNRYDYTFTAYYTDDNSISCSAFAVSAKVGSNLSPNDGVAIVDKIAEAVTDDGAMVYKISMYKKGAYINGYMYTDTVFHLYDYIDGNSDGRYLSSSAYDSTEYIRSYTGKDLKKGDVIAYATDSYGIINEFAFLYSASEDKQLRYWHYTNYLNADRGNRYEYQGRLYSGYLYRKYSDGITYAVMDKAVNSDGTADLTAIEAADKYTYYTGNSSIIYYSKSSDKLSVGTMANLKAYLTDKNDASRIVVYHSYSGLPTLYIIGE